MRILLILSAALLATALACVAAALPAHAETIETCESYIESLPVNINTQGTWCLHHDVATALTSGAAINITTNNVTIDCNGFKIGGLAAGAASTANGIQAVDQLNITVRNCAIRGFHRGIALGGGNHVVEDNRLDQNLYIGIAVFGDGHHVQRNRVYDTGGAPDSVASYGITGAADMIDNTVDGVFATADGASVYGINTSEPGSEVRDNRVRTLVPQGNGDAYGLLAGAIGITVRGNSLSQAVATSGNGIWGPGSQTFCTDNVAIGFSVPFSSCDAGFTNLGL